MYISKEVHDALCLAGVQAIILIFAVMGLALAFPRIVRWTSYLRCRVLMWVRYKRDIIRIRRAERRHRAQLRRDARWYRAAMRVFDEPVRWTEDVR